MSRYSGAPSPVLSLVPDGTDDGRAPAILTDVGARKLTDEIKRDLTSIKGKLRRAREGKAHRALGYPNYHTYCEVEFGNLGDLALPVEERRELVASMRSTDPPLSHEVIAKRLGVSVGTVYKDRKAIGAPDDLPRSLTLLTEEAPRPDYSGLFRTDQALLLIRDQEEKGLTSVELDHETGWERWPGLSSGTLSRLKARGLVEPIAKLRRGRAPHVVTAKGRVAAGKLDEQLAAAEADADPDT